MLVVDTEKSEKGPQRRRAEDGKLLHCCCICGKLEPWSDAWSGYWSYKELDDAVPIPKFCSSKCKKQGGSDAENVTADMKRKAKDTEWREPNVVWREATDREKYDEAAYRQRKTRPAR